MTGGKNWSQIKWHVFVTVSKIINPIRIFACSRQCFIANVEKRSDYIYVENVDVTKFCGSTSPHPVRRPIPCAVKHFRTKIFQVL